jgi:hypothetical protein
VLLKRLLYTSASILLLAPAFHLGASIASATTVLYSSFGPGDTFDTTSGWSIGGSGACVQGLQFTPTESGVVETIEIAAFRLAGGTAVKLTLMTDAGDQLGSVLETLTICCFGDVAAIGLANSILQPMLTGGTKYWLVVSAATDADYFGWSRNFAAPFLLNAQQCFGQPWNINPSWRGTLRISSDTSTPTKATTWGRVKALYR